MNNTLKNKKLIQIRCGLADMAFSSDLDKIGLKKLAKYYYNQLKDIELDKRKEK